MKRATANRGFSTMLADEYILIVPFAYQLQSGLDVILFGFSSYLHHQ